MQPAWREYFVGGLIRGILSLGLELLRMGIKVTRLGFTAATSNRRTLIGIIEDKKFASYTYLFIFFFGLKSTIIVLSFSPRSTNPGIMVLRLVLRTNYTFDNGGAKLSLIRSMVWCWSRLISNVTRILIYFYMNTYSIVSSVLMWCIAYKSGRVGGDGLHQLGRDYHLDSPPGPVWVTSGHVARRNFMFPRA